MKDEIPKIYTFNKGEWSEAYCLVKVIADGKLRLVDSELLTKQDFIKVVGGEISFYNSKEIYKYSFNENILEIFTSDAGALKIDIATFKHLHPLILDKILNAKSRTFAINEIQEIFSKVGIFKLKSHSLSKADLIFKVADGLQFNEEYLGFSVKSFLAGSPTLVNASGATNFIFETGVNKKDYLSYKELKAKGLLRKLVQENETVNYLQMESKTYHKNLMLIDTNMPLIIAETLKLYYSDKICMIKDIVDRLKASNPLRLVDVGIYENKIKDFLFHSALGLFPDKEWDGLRSVDGGCIIINSSGDLGVFYIVRKAYVEFFRQYLFQNCYLDTASTTRHKFGRLVFEETTKQCHLKLNLQIRVKGGPKK